MVNNYLGTFIKTQLLPFSFGSIGSIVVAVAGGSSRVEVAGAIVRSNSRGSTMLILLHSQ